jgi:hypothetical protein
MVAYTIQIWNQSKHNKSYVAFMQAPIVTAQGGEPEVYTNAWATFPDLTNGGFDTVIYNDTTFAYWGVSPSETAQHAVVMSGGVAPVDTTSSDALLFNANGPVGFAPMQGEASAGGTFEIVAGAISRLTTATCSVWRVPERRPCRRRSPPSRPSQTTRSTSRRSRSST